VVVTHFNFFTIIVPTCFISCPSNVPASLPWQHSTMTSVTGKSPSKGESSVSLLIPSQTSTNWLLLEGFLNLKSLQKLSGHIDY
jgi:hypothetical protein